MQHILSYIQNARLALNVGDIGSAETELGCAAKLVEEKFTSTNKQIMPCQKHGSVGIRLVTKVVCAECGEPVDRVFVTA